MKGDREEGRNRGDEAGINTVLRTEMGMYANINKMKKDKGNRSHN